MSEAESTGTLPADEPTWPGAAERPTVFLIDASSGFERRLLEDWIERTRPAQGPAPEVVSIPASRRRTRRQRMDPRLEQILATEGDPLLAPLRVCWLPRARGGERVARWSDLIKLGDPRDPGALRQRWVKRREPDRCRIVAGEPAPASELRGRWREAGGSGTGETTGLPEFVARQAVLALERAERRLRGARYKVPHFVHEDILARPAFRGGLARLAREEGREETRLARDAARYLREIAATHSRFVIDLMAHFIRWLYTRGYSETLHYDRQQLESIYALTQRHPVVFMPSHKSNLDHLALQYALHENGHPPNHTAGGINMNFFPLGGLWRRSGVFFIRRSFKDNETYKFVLRQYIDYLIEKRFTLEWYIEGGRSRSGKLLPPRYGLLGYVVDAYRRGKSDDAFLIPVSIAYDQIQDVRSYTAEQSGGIKERESFGWFLRLLRTLRNPFGSIALRFGEPLSLRKALGPPSPDAEPAADDVSLAIQKLAFEVCVRINRVTPITPTSLVTMALLGRGDRALTLDQVRTALRNRVAYVEERGLPVTQELDLKSDQALRRTLDELATNRVVNRYDEGPETVWGIGSGQHLTAAYYRNTIVHFFVNPAIAELSLLRAAEEDVLDRPAEFWNEAMRLRDLLKFEFFFAEKELFRGELRQEMSFHDAEWESRIARGSAEILGLLYRIRPFNAHVTLRPLLEAYRVVGDELAELGADTEFDETKFLSACLARGKQYQLQRRIRSAESVSKVLFATALRLARNRGLLEAGGPGLAERREAFANELREAVRRVEGIDAMAATRRAGIIN